MLEEFGRYQLLELIGRGGMGEVYRALDTVRERTVALKVLPDYLAGDASFETRFRRESRMAAKLNEPHIIPIHDFGEIDGRLFIDMRLVEGRDLGSRLASQGTLPVATAVDVIAQAAAALDAAHASGLVHRDVKPSNILLTGLDQDPDALPFAYLVDFGIARSSAQEGTALTATTATVGTVAYMSPERISGRPSDLRTDVYALACVLYETLAGRKPFEGEMFAQMYAHMNTPPPRASADRAGVPAALDAVIAKGMAKAPEDRFASAGALAAAARAATRPGAGAAASGFPPRGPAPQTWRAAPPAPDVPRAVPPPASNVPRSIPPPVSNTPGPARPGSAPPGSFPPGRPATAPNLPVPGGRHTNTSRRNAVLVAIAVVVLAIGAVVGVLATRGGDNTAAPGPTGNTSQARTGGSTAFPSSADPSLNTGGPNTASVDWAHFASFSKLVGTKNGDTDHSFDADPCMLSAAASADSTSGALDEVQCTSRISTATITVARFATGDQVQSYLHDRLDSDRYHQLIWTVSGLPRGTTIITPRSGSGAAVITTSFCGLPNYLVQISSPDRKTMSTLKLYNQVWISATFPDVTPPECDETYAGAKAGAPVEASAGPTKDVLPMTSDIIRTLVQRGDTTLAVVQVNTAGGTDAMSVGQQGSVSFWIERADTLMLDGTATYPYSPSELGSPGAAGSGTVLTGMTDATFVVRGTFSGDGSGNAVAYTNGPKGWGAIKAQSNGTLAPSGAGVGISGLGLSDDFGLVDGRLQTIDCSKDLPTYKCRGNNRVIKYWTWRTTYFAQTGRAGRTH